MAKERQKRDRSQHDPKVVDELLRNGVEPYGLLAGVRWLAPPKSAMTVADGSLRWTNGRQRTVSPAEDAGAPFFTDFIELARLSPDAAQRHVLAYAKRWGPLGLCRRHGWPSTHAPLPRPVGRQSTHPEPASKGCPPSCRNGVCSEPIERWLELAKQAEAMLLARVDLANQRSIPAHRFETMRGSLPLALAPSVDLPSRAPKQPVPVDPDGRLMLANPIGKVGDITLRLRQEYSIAVAANGWLKIGGARPSFKWSDTDFVMSIEAETLFGALALRLCGHLSNVRPLARCRFCGKWYVQHRRGSFCCKDPECGHQRRLENKRRQRAGWSRKRSGNL